MDGAAGTPVLVAAAGPKALTAMAGRERELAGERAEQLDLSMNIFVVGDRVARWVQQFIGGDPETLIAHDSLTKVRGTPDDMAAELQRRRAEMGVPYITVNSAAIEAFAPMIPLLDER